MSDSIDPTAARKRRKEIMQTLRAENAKKDEPIIAAVLATTAAAASPVTTTSPTTTTTETSTTDATNTNTEPEAPEALPPPKKRKVTAPKKQVVQMEEIEEEIVEEIPGGTARVTTITMADGKKKTQIRYDPETPMGKEQLAAWRREARRVRNRESAAASRQRIRDRINELEGEVDEWKMKYSEAVDRLAQLERIRESSG